MNVAQLTSALVLVGASRLVAQDAGERPPYMPAYKDAIVTVEVVNAEGRPVADVPVQACFVGGLGEVACIRGMAFFTSPALPPTMVVGTTRSNGRCDLRIAKAGLPLHLHATAIGADRQRVRVRLNAPFANPPSSEFAMGDRPNGPVRLVLSPSMSLTVKVVDAADKIDPTPSVVAIERLDARPKHVPYDETTGPVVIPTVDGVANFSHVGLGQRLRVSARVGSEMRSRFVEIDVPAEERSSALPPVLLRPDDAVDDTELTLRVVDAEGRPIARAPVMLDLLTNPSLSLQLARRESFRMEWSGAAEEPTTDAGVARFRIPACARSGPWLTTAIRVRVAGPAPGSGALRSVYSIPRGLRRREDFGDVQLVELPILADGVVLDANDRPIDGARVCVQSRYLSLVDVVVDSIVDANLMAEAFAHESWISEPWLETITDARGRYVIRGETSAKHLRLEVSKRGRQTLHLPVGRMGKASSTPTKESPVRTFDGRVLIDPEIDTRRISVVLEGAKARCRCGDAECDDAHESRAAPPVYERVTLEADGSFVFSRIPDCSVKLSVVASGRPALEVPPFDVDGSLGAHPEALAALDLRGKVRRHHVRVVDPAQRPIADAEVEIVQWTSFADDEPSRTNLNGDVWLQVPHSEPIEIRVRAPKIEMSEIKTSKIDGDGVIVIGSKKDRSVRVRLKNPDALPRSTYWLHCRLDTETTSPEAERGSIFGEPDLGTPFDGTGLALVEVPSAGCYEVVLQIVASMPDLAFKYRVKFSGPTTVTVSADGTDTFDVEVDAAAIEAAILKPVDYLFF